MPGNIAKVRSQAAEAQAFINVLCRHAVGREFAGPDSGHSVAVVENAHLRVGRALDSSGFTAPGAKFGQPASERPSSPVVTWKSADRGLIYFAPTGSDVKSEYLAGARRGTVHELISFNLQARPSVEPQLDHDLIYAAGLVEFLAGFCHGGAFSSADETSTVTSFTVQGEDGRMEPVVMWADRSGAEERKVCFLPQDSTVPSSIIELMNAQLGSQGDLLEFKSKVSPWLAPALEKLAHEQQSLYGHGLGD
jgi:hypothetical protein